MPTLSIPQMVAYAKGAGFGDKSALFGAIGMAESGGRTDVINYLGCVGWLQIFGRVHRPAHPHWTDEWLKNPANNAQAGYEIYKSQGLHAWTVYTTGAYRQYLPEAQRAAGRVGPTEEPTGGGVNPLNPVEVGRAVGGNLAGINASIEAMSNRETWIRILYVATGIAACLIALVQMSAGSKTLQSAGKAAVTVASRGKL